MTRLSIAHTVTGVLLATSAALFAAGAAAAAEPPVLKSGLWEVVRAGGTRWREVPAQLYFFIDACRTFNRNVAEQMGTKPQPLLVVKGIH